MILVDTSAWIEWLIGSATGDAVAEHLPDQADWLVPTMVQLELAKWLTREVGEDKADQVIAFTPLTMESRKFTTPRMNGYPIHGCLSLLSLSGSTRETSVPSLLRQTMACRSTPRMRMPSMSACPPMEVRKPQDLLFFNSGFSFVSAIVR